MVLEGALTSQRIDLDKREAAIEAEKAVIKSLMSKASAESINAGTFTEQANRQLNEINQLIRSLWN